MLNTLEKLKKYWWAVVDEDGRDVSLEGVNQNNALGESPIHIAAWKGDPSDIQWLFDQGAQLNERGDFDMTPLHYAYMGAKEDNIKLLLKLGADPSTRCDRGFMPHERPRSD